MIRVLIADDHSAGRNAENATTGGVVGDYQTKVTGKRMVRVLAWYDNEWGFSARMADVAGVMGRLN